MPSKINTARICLLVLAWLSVLSAVFVALMFLLLTLGIGLSNEEGSGIGAIIFGSFGLIISLASAALALLTFLVAKGIREKKNWAKITGIVIAVLNILNVPLGTILGILILIGLIDEDATAWFTPQSK